MRCIKKSKTENLIALPNKFMPTLQSASYGLNSTLWGFLIQIIDLEIS